MLREIGRRVRESLQSWQLDGGSAVFDVTAAGGQCARARSRDDVAFGLVSHRATAGALADRASNAATASATPVATTAPHNPAATFIPTGSSKFAP